MASGDYSVNPLLSRICRARKGIPGTEFEMGTAKCEKRGSWGDGSGAREDVPVVELTSLCQTAHSHL